MDNDPDGVIIINAPLIAFLNCQHAVFATRGKVGKEIAFSLYLKRRERVLDDGDIEDAFRNEGGEIINGPCFPLEIRIAFDA